MGAHHSLKHVDAYAKPPAVRLYLAAVPVQIVPARRHCSIANTNSPTHLDLFELVQQQIWARKLLGKDILIYELPVLMQSRI